MSNKSFFNYRQFIFLAFSSILVAGCDRVLTPDFETELTEMKSGAYTIDKDHASLNFKINHLNFSTYVGRFNNIDASLDFDPANIEQSSLEVIIDMASIDVNNPAFAEQLKGSGWLEVEQFPQAIYRTTKFVESTGENSFTFEGDLTFHGKTAPVLLNVTFHGGGRNMLTRKNTLGFSANASFKRSDFGVSRFTSMGVGDDVELEIHVEFQESEKEKEAEKE